MILLFGSRVSGVWISSELYWIRDSRCKWETDILYEVKLSGDFSMFIEREFDALNFLLPQMAEVMSTLLTCILLFFR